MTDPDEPGRPPLATVSRDDETGATYVTFRPTGSARTVQLDAGTLVDVDADGQVVGVEVLHPEAAQLRARVAAVAALKQPDPPLLDSSPEHDSAWAAGWWTCYHAVLVELTDPAEVAAVLARNRAAQAPYDPERRGQARARFRETLRGMLDRMEAEPEG